MTDLIRCSGCHGENHPGDDHPKALIMGLLLEGDPATGSIEVSDPKYYHFDCFPDAIKALDHAPDTLAKIEAAENGTHGDELRDWILKHHKDNDALYAADAEAKHAELVSTQGVTDEV